MKIVAIDPGDVKSAYVVWDGNLIQEKDIVLNDELLPILTRLRRECDTLILEMIASYGMAVGHHVFTTCVWIGRYKQYWLSLDGQCHLIYRKDVKMHHTLRTTAKDSNIIQAIKDRFGPPGTKKDPNPVTYGLKRDLWQAFALALYWYDSYARS